MDPRLTQIADLLSLPAKRLCAVPADGGVWLLFGRGKGTPKIPNDRRLVDLKRGMPAVEFYWSAKRVLGIFVPGAAASVGDVGLPFGYTEIGFLGIHLTKRGAQAARDRREDRQDDRQDRKAERQGDRRERHSERQDDRHDRKAERQNDRHDRKADARGTRQDRKTLRMSRRQDRKDDRTGRRHDRKDYRTEQRQDRKWGRQEAKGKFAPRRDNDPAAYSPGYAPTDNGGGGYEPSYDDGYDAGFDPNGYAPDYEPDYGPELDYLPDYGGGGNEVEAEGDGSEEFYDSGDNYEDPWAEVDNLNAMGDGYTYYADEYGDIYSY